MKRLLYAAIAVLIVAGLLALGANHFEKEQSAATGKAGSSTKVLNIYNWGAYIDPNLIAKFEKQTGYKVNYDTFDSNEAMLTKIQQGGTSYDITVPSEYTVQKMKQLGLLHKLDLNKIPTLKYYDKNFLNLAFDPHNQYSVPYFWGTLGITYNDKYVKPEQIQTWNDLWKPEFRDSIMLTDDARDVFGFALISLNKSVNTTNNGDLMAAKGKLDALAPNIKAIAADEIKMYMAQDQAPLAVGYSGDASEMIAENSHLHYVIPKDGTNLWFDNLVIPKNAKHLKAAYAFINFINEPKNAAQNAEYIGYSTPNAAAKKLLPKAITAQTNFYPTDEMMKKFQVYTNLSQAKTEEYNDLYLEFKMVHR
ncbi:ABC transporter substrate-binding protein [Periweissella fabalis]|uniref:ABC transporter substrate-binding protein n=1 Tax=Periweissella fabalis TaxID=1070421 RepID=A0A7X6S2V0_9LACO|nr:ABC transporter substrate-binding protein [Periweissella fabalis]MCM0599725.1 ABC transporter substrate-binding protein [Periweissella fabalis]NKZ24469.1 ABC transporter substrate-binding protein [Periweissella fabalis]